MTISSSTAVSTFAIIIHLSITIGGSACGQQIQRQPLGSNERAETVASFQVDEQEAISIAIEQLGLKRFDRTRASAERVVLTEECLPFLGEQLAGRETWKVDLHGVDLARDAESKTAENPHIRHLIVVLAPGKAQVLKATSEWPEGVTPIAPYPSVEEQERQFRATDVTYLRLPERAPSITLLSALTSPDVMTWSPDVKQIYAIYVTASSIKYQEKDIWAIEIRGFPPMRPSLPPGADGTDIPVDALNHLREVVDAHTGEWLGAGTVPQPVAGDRDLQPLEQRY